MAAPIAQKILEAYFHPDTLQKAVE
jgi:hypothetical protein